MNNRRFESIIKKCVKDENSGCILWNGAVDKDGYGRVQNSVNGRLTGLTPVHRMIWKLQNGEIEKTMLVRHKCRNKHCCEITHLEIGTVMENSEDRRRDGTMPMGENTDVLQYLKLWPKKSKIPKEMVLSNREQIVLV